MLKLLLVSILLNSITVSLGIETNNYPSENNNDSEYSEALQRFTDSVLIFSTSLLKNYADSKPCESVAFAPMTLILNIATFAPYAEGSTKNEILYTVLNLKTREEVIYVANYIDKEIKDLPDCITYRASQNLFGNINYPFTPEFKRFQNEVIKGVLENLDFSYSMQAAAEINAIVASDTDNKIPTIIENDSIFNNCTQLVAASASYIEGEWKIGFEISNHLKEFKVSPTQSEPQTFLYQGAEYLYAHSGLLGAEVIQIDFCCDSFYLWEVLPDCPFAVDAVIEKMAQNTDWYYEILENLKLTKLELHIPRSSKVTTVDSLALVQKATVITSPYLDLKGVIEENIPVGVTVGRHSTYSYLPPDGGPVPNETMSKPAKVVSADYPHVWITFRQGRVYFIGVNRGPVDTA